MNNKNESYRLRVAKAMINMLKVNYHIFLLDMAIFPNYVGWSFAVSFRNDPHSNWQPKLILYSDATKKLIVSDRFDDPRPTEIDAETVLSYSLR
jgi:hypothetical protein